MRLQLTLFLLTKQVFLHFKGANIVDFDIRLRVDRSWLWVIRHYRKNDHSTTRIAETINREGFFNHAWRPRITARVEMVVGGGGGGGPKGGGGGGGGGRKKKKKKKRGGFFLGRGGGGGGETPL